MTQADLLIRKLDSARKYFDATTSVLEADDAGFTPETGMFSVAAQVAHVADTVDWFVDGAFGPGWDLDFEASVADARAVEDLAEARAWLDRAFDRAREVIGGASEEDLMAPIPDERMMKGAPRAAIVEAIVDHTAHHRGALAVYARLLGKTPPMPYV